MTENEEKLDRALRELDTAERADRLQRKLRRVRHLVATYDDVCSPKNDPHAARIMKAIREAAAEEKEQ